MCTSPMPSWPRPSSPKARSAGLVLLSCGVYGNVIRILVPLTASDAILDEGMAILRDTLAALC